MNQTILPQGELLSCNEIQLHYKRQLFETMPHLNDVKEVEKYLRDMIDLKRIDLVEFFWVLYLTNSNRLIAMAEIGVGSSTQVGVSVKTIFQKALLVNAIGIIVAHNHPSGNLQASDADISITKKISQAAKFLDMVLIDHIIITSEGFMSFAKEGLL
ncbi:JAB domain-containing protein [Flavobacterium sp.]|uniref:JAB domain-containing protein n=1 Tax=Flavobacterium sp. TaxID=239 RepID=UPI003F697554